MASSIFEMKILPSPILPVRAEDENRLHGLFDEFVGHNHLQLYFRKKVDRVFASAIKLGVALLTAVAPCFKNGHALDADFHEGVFDCIQLRRLNHRFNLLHRFNPRDEE